MSQADQTGKGSARKLGRGLSALLGAPVQIRAEQDAQSQERTPPTSAAVQTDPMSMQEAIAPKAPVQAPPYVPRGPMNPSVPATTSTNPPKQAVGDPEAPAGAPSLREIPVEQIVPNRRQPRTDFDDTTIQSLAASIRQAGLMQPIMVRPTAKGFELVAGERRWRAAKLIGLRVIPAVVRDMDDQASAELALIENVQREDLNPMDRAVALRRLADDFGLTHQVIAERVGLDRPSVTNLLRLSELDAATAEFVRRAAISQGHAKALLGVADLPLRVELAQKVVSEGWSVRELERRVQHTNNVKPVLKGTSEPSTAEPTPRSANVADLERKLAEHLGTRVAIQLGRKQGSGRLVLQFYSLDQFDGLMQKLGFGNDR